MFECKKREGSHLKLKTDLELYMLYAALPALKCGGRKELQHDWVQWSKLPSPPLAGKVVGCGG